MNVKLTNCHFIHIEIKKKNYGHYVLKRFATTPRNLGL